ncbi:hemerythrin domain-containing protein [Micromonospora sp. NPDC127501]|uniref:hemerythrin domain-containing protein n=1 Tax=Micromonospora sp. NPDC127501 TaxID=3154872 RepID=UPI003330F766
MPDADTPATPGPEEDVVDLLLAQHAQIEQLFLLVIGGTGDTRRDAFDDLVKLLAAHETAEEEVVHPLARTLPGGGGDAMVDDRLDEERQAKETLQTLIKGGVDADGFDTGIVLLRGAVLLHARHEERYEFPQLRQHVPVDRLRSLATAVRAAEASAPTRPHPSAQSAKGNLAAGPVLAVIDRVRDAVRKPSESGPESAGR